MQHYIAWREDPIDMKLANFLNSKTEKLPISFIRVDRGIYYYGSKRIMMKIEQKSDSIIVRVGGTFMQL